MTNNVQFNLAQPDQDAVAQAIVDLHQKLGPHLLALTDEQRQGGLKMGDKSVAFVQKATSYGADFVDHLPKFIDLAALKQDTDAVTLLNAYRGKLAALLRSVEDTMMLAGSEAMEASVAVYSSIKLAAHNNVPGAQAAYNDMKTRFPGRPSTGNTPPTPPANP